MPPGNGDHDLTGKPNAGERKALLILLPLLLLIGAQAAASDKCSLQRNVIQTRAQLRDCDFRTVVVLPHVHELRQALMGGDAIQSERVPFPVIECSIIPGVSFNKSLFFQIMSDSANHLDTMPPCVRPALGREAVAYASGDMEDCVWHRLTGSKKRRDLERMYVKYFEKYLGPLPEDLAHFCCAQFLPCSWKQVCEAKYFYGRAVATPSGCTLALRVRKHSLAVGQAAALGREMDKRCRDICAEQAIAD
eukprot:gene9620-7534_t